MGGDILTFCADAPNFFHLQRRLYFWNGFLLKREVAIATRPLWQPAIIGRFPSGGNIFIPLSALCGREYYGSHDAIVNEETALVVM